MTPQQALQVLDQMAQQAHAPRADHATAQQAVQVLSEALARLDEDTDTPAEQ